MKIWMVIKKELLASRQYLFTKQRDAINFANENGIITITCLKPGVAGNCIPEYTLVKKATWEK